MFSKMSFIADLYQPVSNQGSFKLQHQNVPLFIFCLSDTDLWKRLRYLSCRHFSVHKEHLQNLSKQSIDPHSQKFSRTGSGVGVFSNELLGDAGLSFRRPHLEQYCCITIQLLLGGVILFPVFPTNWVFNLKAKLDSCWKFQARICHKWYCVLCILSSQMVCNV